MIKYFARRIFSIIITLFLIVTATFFLMHSVPGGPFTTEKSIQPEILVELQKHFGIDKPLHMQYVDYLGKVVKWDLGPSFKERGTSVNEIINRGFPVSARLGIQAILMAIFGGITLGVIAALKHAKWQDNVAMLIAVLGLSVPSFVLASFYQYIFAIELKWLPIAKWGTFEHTILPSLALCALPLAFIARLTRSNMIEVLNQDYIKTAKAKGLSTSSTVIRHAIRNTLLPVITYLGPLIASIITGTFVIERIFGIPGLGKEFVTSISNRDYTVIMGTTVFYSVILVVLVFLVDIVYTFVDPRIKLVDTGKE